MRNIHDERYDITVKYLRNLGADLKECVTAIRKEESVQMRKRAAKRKLQNTIRRIGNSNYDVMESAPKRVRKLSGTIETTKNGFLSIPNIVWPTLNEEDKAFVQKYNAKIKHNEPTEKWIIPDGVVIAGKPRRARSIKDDNDDDKAETTLELPSKKQKHGRKKVQFSLAPESSNDKE